jgi:hypothetical protein
LFLNTITAAVNWNLSIYPSVASKPHDICLPNPVRTTLLKLENDLKVEAKRNILTGPAALVNEFRSKNVPKSLYPYLKTHHQLTRIVQDARTGLKIHDPIDVKLLSLESYEVLGINICIVLPALQDSCLLCVVC